jgi:hypothetical protein
VAKFQYLTSGNGLPGNWFIELNGHTCKLSHLEGLGYLLTILRYRSLHLNQLIGTEPPPESLRTSLMEAFWSEEKTEDGTPELADGYQTSFWQSVGGSCKRIKGTGRALPIQQLNGIIEELNRQQRAAFKDGDKERADQLGQALIGARYYKSTTFGLHGKQRTFLSEFSRTNDAVRKAIERAIAAIAKTSVPIADHLKKTIRGERGVWSYTGAESWQLYKGDVLQQAIPEDPRPAGPKWGQQKPCSRPRHPNTVPGWPNRHNDPEMKTIEAFAKPTEVLQELFKESVKEAAWWCVPTAAIRCREEGCNSPALRDGHCVKHTFCP